MRQRYFFLFLIFFGCNTAREDKNDGSFFKMKEYFTAQADQLHKHHIQLQKKIIKDNKEESKSITNPDWKKELRPFEDCDLNKPAWKKSYKADTVRSGDSTSFIYTAIESKLSVRKLIVMMKQDTVYRINISIDKRNSYYNSTQELQYEPWKSYGITGSQKVILADPTNFSIKANFN